MKKTLLIIFPLCYMIAVKAQSSGWSVSFTPSVVDITELHYGLQLGAGYKLN